MKLDTEVLKQQFMEEFYARLEQAYHAPTDSLYQAKFNTATNELARLMRLVHDLEEAVTLRHNLVQARKGKR